MQAQHRKLASAGAIVPTPSPSSSETAQLVAHVCDFLTFERRRRRQVHAPASQILGHGKGLIPAGSAIHRERVKRVEERACLDTRLVKRSHNRIPWAKPLLVKHRAQDPERALSPRLLWR